jgi:Glycosyl hydrolases family 16
MRFVVHGVLENQTSDPPDALDMHKGYELSDSAAAARRQHRMSPGVIGLHRIAAVNSSVYGLATLLLRVTVFLSIFALRANAQDAIPPAAAGMRLSFSETFHAPLSWCSERCQGEKWRTKYNHSGDTPLSRGLGMSGSESEIFMDPTYLDLGVNPFHIDHGTLSLLIEPASERVKSTVLAAWPSWWGGKKVAPRFTAGMLSTEKSFQQMYGYFEARIKISNVPGTWPAFWLLSLEKPGDEIDVMEILGGRPTRQHMSDHWKVDGQKHDQSKTLDTVDLSNDFHTYGLFWMPDTITYYLDNVEVGRFPNLGLHSPMYLIISMGMDGDWNKTDGYRARPDAHAKMVVQFVKSYR